MLNLTHRLRARGFSASSIVLGMSTPKAGLRPARPPRGSRKVAKQHFLESTPKAGLRPARPPRGSRKVAKQHFLESREEIGSFLGLKLASGSRTFSKFQANGLLTVRHRHIQVIDTAGLEQLLDGDAD